MKIVKSYVVAGKNSKPHVRIELEDKSNFGVSFGMVANVLNQVGIKTEMVTSADCQALVGMQIEKSAIKSHTAGEVVGDVTFTKEGLHVDLADFNLVGKADYSRMKEATECSYAMTRLQQRAAMLDAVPVEEEDH